MARKYYRVYRGLWESFTFKRLWRVYRFSKKKKKNLYYS